MPSILTPGTAFSTASGTISLGFAKLRIQALGARRLTALATATIAGIVRSALKRPPGPVVSWPITPCRSGIVSSRYRARLPPTRIWVITNCASRTAEASDVVRVIAAGTPWRRAIRWVSPPTMASRLGSMSMRVIASNPPTSRPRSLKNSVTSSGVYTLPAPIMLIFRPIDSSERKGRSDPGTAGVSALASLRLGSSLELHDVLLFERGGLHVALEGAIPHHDQALDLVLDGKRLGVPHALPQQDALAL